MNLQQNITLQNNNLLNNRKELAELKNQLSNCNISLDLNSSPNARLKNNLLANYNQISKNAIKNISSRDIEIDFEITVDGSSSTKKFINEGSGKESSGMQDEDDWVDVEYTIKTKQGAFKNKDINDFMVNNLIQTENINKMVVIVNSLQESLSFIKLMAAAFELKEKEIYNQDKVDFSELNLNEEQTTLLNEFEQTIAEQVILQKGNREDLEKQIEEKEIEIEEKTEELKKLVLENKDSTSVDVISNLVEDNPEKKNSINKIKRTRSHFRMTFGSIGIIAIAFLAKVIINTIKLYQKHSNHLSGATNMLKAALHVIINDKYTFILSAITIIIVGILLNNQEKAARKKALALINN